MHFLFVFIERVLLCLRIVLGTFVLPYLTCYIPYENSFGKVWSKHHIFITGCDTGFGNMLAKRLDSKGFSVIANCLTEDGAKKLRAETSYKLRVIVCDITQDKSLAECVAEVERICGQEGLYAVVNNAGIEDDCTLENQAMASIKRVMDINYFAMVNTTQRLMPLLRKAGASSTGARVINVASVAGRISIPGLGGYCASKHAVEAYSDCLRREMCMFGIKVAIIEPELMGTNIVNKGNSGIRTKWANLSDEVRTAYGEDYHEHICAGREKVKDVAQDPIKVIYAMEKALLQAYPKTRYSVGSTSPLFILNEYVPACVYDCILTASLPRPAQAKYGKCFS